MKQNVIPFQSRPEPDALAFTIGARVDLRVGAIAAGVIRPRGLDRDLLNFSTLARLLRAARMAWRERGIHAGLTLAVPAALHSDLEAAMLDEAAVEAGCTRPMFAFELDERELDADGAALAEDLRARGWSIVLRGDPDCPLPMGARARALYAELVVDAPAEPDPYLALRRKEWSPLERRILAAKEAGLVVTAAAVQNAAQARLLAAAGFDRGGGPHAEAGIR